MSSAAPISASTRWRLIDDFRWVLTNAWSVRFNVASAVFGGVSAFVGFLLLKDVDFPIGPKTLAIVGGVSTALTSLSALAARFVKQDRSAPDGDDDQA